KLDHHRALCSGITGLSSSFTIDYPIFPTNFVGLQKWRKKRQKPGFWPLRPGPPGPLFCAKLSPFWLGTGLSQTHNEGSRITAPKARKKRLESIGRAAPITERMFITVRAMLHTQRLAGRYARWLFRPFASMHS